MEAADLESIVAAILTAGSLDQSQLAPRITVNRYVEVLQALREAGGHRDPTLQDRKSNLP
jgi:hypothetical protein